MTLTALTVFFISEELSSHSWSICFVVTVDDISDGLHHDLDV